MSTVKVPFELIFMVSPFTLYVFPTMSVICNPAVLPTVFPLETIFDKIAAPADKNRKSPYRSNYRCCQENKEFTANLRLIQMLFYLVDK